MKFTTKILVSCFTGVLLVVFIVVPPSYAQSTVVLGRKPRTLPGAIGQQVGVLGNSILEYKRLKIEREGNIARLRNELERCGTCPDRANIQAELDRWLEIDRRVRAVEGAALESMGLGELRDFNDLGEALKDALKNPDAYRKKAQIFGLESIVHQNCLRKYAWAKKAQELPADEREAMYKDEKKLRAFQQKWTQLEEQCRNEHINQNERVAIIAHREAAMNLCFDEHDYSVVKDPRGYNAMRGSYKSCMDVNDVLTHLCIENNVLMWEESVARAKKDGRVLRQQSRPAVDDHRCHAFPDQRQMAVFRSRRTGQQTQPPGIEQRPSRDIEKKRLAR